MTAETVSWLFSQFQDHGLLQVERKHIKILDFNGLQALNNKYGDLSVFEDESSNTAS